MRAHPTLLVLLAACAPVTYSRAPDLPAYAPRSADRHAADPSGPRAQVEDAERSLHRRVPPSVALLRDSVERIVSQLGERCTPHNPDGDGLHWQISCATETLFALGAFEPADASVLERWRAVGQTLAQLQADAAAEARTLRVAVSGFADHVRFASDHPCADLARFWGASVPQGTEARTRNAALSFCRAARMGQEIACATLPAGRCSSATLAGRPGLAFAVFGGSTTVLDDAPERFTTAVTLAGGEAVRCPCHRLGADEYGPPPTAADALAACPTGDARLYACDDARRVELDVWLDVDPRPDANTCALQAAEPNARALVCYQDGWRALSHQSALPRPRTNVVRDACATPNPRAWIEGRVRTDGRPCAAEVSVAR